MLWLHAIILGIVEGLTEFLPISSTGHLILFNQWIAFSPDFTKIFDIVIQCGAILAVVVMFWKKMFVVATWQKVIVAVLPALGAGALFGSVIQEFLFSPTIVALSLIVGGLILFFVENRRHTESIRDIKHITYGQAFCIGLAQCVAMIPGMSRSAMTIIGGLFLGASRPVAAEFSFFLAIPTLIAASGYSLLKDGIVLTPGEIGLLAIGFVAAFISALAVIRFFLRYIQHHTFLPFAYYRIALGLAILIFFAW
jgi:undecaprenyl-diphosphatase